MNAEPEPQPQQSRGTVVMMPRRTPQPSRSGGDTVPAGSDASEPEEPGYGHGV